MAHATKDQVQLAIQDFRTSWFSRQMLDRLDKDLCSLLGLDKPCQHRLIKDDKNPRKGSVEVAKFNGYRLNESSEIEEEVKRFYEKEGFKVNRGRSYGAMDVVNNNESYSIFITEGDTSWSVHVF